MRIDVSPAISRAFPDLDELLWNVGVYSKESDWDIKLMGLYVRIKKHRFATQWYGWAHPQEESTLYGRRFIHPAGRIDLGVGCSVGEDEIVRLFAHELRHIGQFHRGRKIYGYLTTEHMKEQRVESDCYEFEEYIAKKFGPAHSGYHKADTRQRTKKRRLGR